MLWGGARGALPQEGLVGLLEFLFEGLGLELHLCQLGLHGHLGAFELALVVGHEADYLDSAAGDPSVIATLRTAFL